MINLIPIKEKKNIHKDFYIRFFILSFYVLSFGVIVNIILLTPSLFYSSIQKNIIKSQTESLKNNNTGVDPKYSFLIEDLNFKLKKINDFRKEQFLISENIINEVLKSKTLGINITSINYYKDPIKGKILQLNGYALTRENLLFYKNSLEDNKNFKQIDLPISSFIKSKNLQFNLIINLI